MNKLNLFAGFDIMPKEEGWINVDFKNFDGIDEVINLNNFPYPYEDNTFDEIKIKDGIHCIENLILFMEEIYRISKPNAVIVIESVNFLSPICCQDPYFKTRIGWNTFDIFNLEEKEGYCDNKASFNIISRKWIFSENKKLEWLSFLFNIFPKVYARFFYFLMPCNKIKFLLQVKK